MLVTPPKQGTGNRLRNRLSVVVPVFNEEAGITDCIERLLAEGDTIDEILIVDNNSTDRTASIIKRYAGSHEKVRYIFESRQGVVHARNAGFDASTCEIVGRIDADTRVQSGWATAISEFLGPNSTTAPLRALHTSSNPLSRTSIGSYLTDKFDAESSIMIAECWRPPERTWRSRDLRG